MKPSAEPKRTDDPIHVALFVDVMGVQNLLVPVASAGQEPTQEPTQRLDRCRTRLEDFHRDLNDTVERDLPLLFRTTPTAVLPHFVAEFSDCAYVVGSRFGDVAVAGLLLMRKALRHGYPLRGGIGMGTFAHEASGVRASGSGAVWSTSSFLGGAIVTAYLAERSVALGTRVFVHPTVGSGEAGHHVSSYTVPLLGAELNDQSSHELRLWRSSEAPSALQRLQGLCDAEHLAERVRQHYEATFAAYCRFALIAADLPLIPPALWL